MGTNVASGASTDKSVESRRRIVESARHEVESKGILGLRVQDVARNAGVSVPLIYKYFGDRDGLLAEVLSGMFVERSNRHLDAARQVIARHGEGTTVDDIVAAFVLPGTDDVKRDRALTLQMLAAGAEIPSLAARLAETEREIHAQVVEFVTATFRTIGLENAVPVAALAMLLQASSLGFVFNDLLGAAAVPDEEFTRLTRVLVESVVERHSALRS